MSSLQTSCFMKTGVMGVKEEKYLKIAMKPSRAETFFVVVVVVFYPLAASDPTSVTFL